MTEEKKENQEVDSPIAEADIQGLGAAGKSLNSALKQVFFTVLGRIIILTNWV